MRRHNFKNIYIAHIDEISFKYIYFLQSFPSVSCTYGHVYG